MDPVDGWFTAGTAGAAATSTGLGPLVTLVVGCLFDSVVLRKDSMLRVLDLSSCLPLPVACGMACGFGFCRLRLMASTDAELDVKF